MCINLLYCLTTLVFLLKLALLLYDIIFISCFFNLCTFSALLICFSSFPLSSLLLVLRSLRYSLLGSGVLSILLIAGCQCVQCRLALSRPSV